MPNAVSLHLHAKVSASSASACEDCRRINENRATDFSAYIRGNTLAQRRGSCFWSIKTSAEIVRTTKNARTRLTILPTGVLLAVHLFNTIAFYLPVRCPQILQPEPSPDP